MSRRGYGPQPGEENRNIHIISPWPTARGAAEVPGGGRVVAKEDAGEALLAAAKHGHGDHLEACLRASRCYLCALHLVSVALQTLDHARFEDTVSHVSTLLPSHCRR